jgi:hypothetical protein
MGRESGRAGAESWYRELVLEDTLRIVQERHSCDRLAGLLAGGVVS